MRWETVQISEFCKTGTGGTPSRGNMERYYEGGTIPWVKSGELRENIITGTGEHVTETALRETSIKLVPAGALLLALYGATVGRLGILGVEATTNQAVCHIIPDPKKANVRYLFHALSDQVSNLVARGVGGAQPNISQGIVKELGLMLPPLAEQKRIAAILDAADALRTKRREALAQLDALLQSSFLTLFGDPVTNPMGWETSPLSGVAHSIVDGPFGSNLKTSDYVAAGVPVLQGKNITGDSFKWFDIRFITPTKARTLARSDARVDDHLLIKIGSIGYSAIIHDLKGHEFAIIPANMCRIRRDPRKVEALFLHAFLTNERTANTLRGLASKTAQPALSLGKIRALTLPLPPLPLQQKFAAIVESVERQKTTQRAHLAELDALFAALQHRAFRGEL